MLLRSILFDDVEGAERPVELHQPTAVAEASEKDRREAERVTERRKGRVPVSSPRSARPE